ncbi:1314_t:CDS:2 [Entrophospora sp. SA101]|nr:1314_t:CDS:2 [Entrophospora sp. SA101]CAJ0915814.1 19768_t:CDS:2 [Entrophospora sp. SA101]
MNNLRRQRKPTVGDLFCGAGGLSLGAAYAGFNVKWAVDKDLDSTVTFHRNHPNTICYNMDVSEFIFDNMELPRHSVDVLLAAPPCQGFSFANTRGNSIDMGELNILTLNVPEAIVKLRPKVLVFENVKGFYYRGGESDTMLKLFLNSLRDVGYKYDSRILMSATYGVPQKRERFILYAVPDDKQLPQWPKETHFIVEETPIEYRDLYTLGGIIPTPTVDEAFRGLTATIPNMNYHRSNPGHLKRLRNDRVSNTVLCSIGSGWNNIHPTEYRYISVREQARLQTFPDDFIFYGTLRSQYRQVGNAVPPLLSKVIMQEVKKIL